ncbi:MAG: hypothetical protein GAK29_04790 [Acinetobacter bereziniae]|uniref:ThiJ/PfpI family protein n=1 Tax=Acinetobacter bereziniae TaxID=106648 RepID=A0A833TTQ5_ACIBZ|nr:MAG: hypothetical protein GAK29_04790 [Acinetobacter bereziniae]
MKTQLGTPFIVRKRGTSFTNIEEKDMALEGDILCLVETELSKLGAKFESAESWRECVVLDGKLITGQNPASANKLSQVILKELGVSE